MRWNVSRISWSVEYANAAIGQTLDFDHGRGAEKRLVAASRGPRGISHEPDAQTSTMFLLAWGRA